MFSAALKDETIETYAYNQHTAQLTWYIQAVITIITFNIDWK